MARPVGEGRGQADPISHAFKYRGSARKVRCLPADSRLVTASTGNHALGLSIAAGDAKASLVVYAPTSAPQAKLDAIVANGAEIVAVEGGYDECEAKAREHAQRHAAQFVHSFDDPEIIDGHRTLYREMGHQFGRPDCAFIPIGGGGLVTAGLLEWGRANTRIVGVEYARAPRDAGFVAPSAEGRPRRGPGDAGRIAGPPDRCTCVLFVPVARLARSYRGRQPNGCRYATALAGSRNPGRGRRRSWPRRRLSRARPHRSGQAVWSTATGLG
ncbi:MAG: pyridoxal-phosphate dependent enzyme [Actinomycetia bacterium]|nr:pyridoxal-phosphate dependent enzyme [Actinomycetes bacterium]